MSASSINRKVAEQIKAKKKEQRDAEANEIKQVDSVNSGQADGGGVSPEERDSNGADGKEAVKVSKKAVAKKAAKKAAKKSSVKKKKG